MGWSSHTKTTSQRAKIFQKWINKFDAECRAAFADLCRTDFAEQVLPGDRAGEQADRQDEPVEPAEQQQNPDLQESRLSSFIQAGIDGITSFIQTPAKSVFEGDTDDEKRDEF